MSVSFSEHNALPTAQHALFREIFFEAVHRHKLENLTEGSDEDRTRCFDMAASRQLSDMKINILVDSIESLPAAPDEPMYAVLMYNAFKPDQIHRFYDVGLSLNSFDIWDEDNLSADSGWDEEQAEVLSNLKLWDGVFNFGLEMHSIIRVR